MATNGYADDCACGGCLGWYYTGKSREYHFWHIDLGSDVRRDSTVSNAYLAQRGRSPETQLMSSVERWHREDRVAQLAREEEAMLAQQRDPRNWPDILDKRVVVTGVLAKYQRAEIARAVEEAGGYHYDKVDRNTDLLVVGLRPGAVKQREAKSYRVPTIGDDDFMALLDRSVTANKRRQRSYAEKSRPQTVLTNTLNRPVAEINVDQEVAPVLRPQRGVDLLTVNTAGPVNPGDVLTVNGQRMIVITTTTSVKPNQSIVYSAEVAPRGVVATPVASPVAPTGVAPRAAKAAAKRSPTFDELLERERYLRGERG